MSDTLPVVETFHSLQGEGHHTGRSAFFIRLAGCTVGCPWCDTKHSWPASAYPKLHVRTLAEEAAKARDKGAAFVVITGGEPLHHNLRELTQALDQICGLPLHLETSGVDPLSGRFDWITLSPKRHKAPAREILQSCDELKVVVHTKEDLIFSEVMARSINTTTDCYLQPGWGSAKAYKLAIDYIKKNNQWRIGLQIHKTLNID